MVKIYIKKWDSGHPYVGMVTDLVIEQGGREKGVFSDYPVDGGDHIPSIAEEFLAWLSKSGEELEISKRTIDVLLALLRMECVRHENLSHTIGAFLRKKSSFAELRFNFKQYHSEDTPEWLQKWCK